MKNEDVKSRMEELMAPIDERIMMCDNVEDVLMLASIMLTTSIGIFRNTLGDDATKVMIVEMLER